MGQRRTLGVKDGRLLGFSSAPPIREDAAQVQSHPLIPFSCWTSFHQVTLPPPGPPELRCLSLPILLEGPLTTLMTLTADLDY